MTVIGQATIVVHGGRGEDPLRISSMLRRRKHAQELSDKMLDYLALYAQTPGEPPPFRIAAARTVMEENRWIQDRATEGLPKFAKQVFGSARAMLVWLEEIRPLLEEHAAEEEDGR